MLGESVLGQLFFCVILACAKTVVYPETIVRVIPGTEEPLFEIVDF